MTLKFHGFYREIAYQEEQTKKQEEGYNLTW